MFLGNAGLVKYWEETWSGLGSEERRRNFNFSTTLLKSLAAKRKRIELQLEQYMNLLLLSLLFKTEEIWHI